MPTVSVATLKEKLSYYLNLVREGHEIEVTSHRHRVARIVPPSTPYAAITPPSRPVSDLREIKGVKRRRAGSVVDSLLADRRRR